MLFQIIIAMMIIYIPLLLFASTYLAIQVGIIRNPSAII